MIRHGLFAVLALSLAGAAQADELSVRERIATLGVMGFRADELAKAGGTVDAQAEALAAFARTLPTMDHVEIQDHVVQGTMKDGITFSFPTSFMVTAPTGAPVPARATRASRALVGETLAPTAGRIDTLRPDGPADKFHDNVISPSKQVRLLQMTGTGPDGHAAIDRLNTLFHDAGYAPLPISDGAAKIDGLRHVSGDAVLYWNTHGGPALFTNSAMLDGDGNPYQFDSSDWKTTYENVKEHGISTERLPDIAADRAEKLLEYQYGEVTDVHGHSSHQWTYAINVKFIEKYWSFAPHAIVYLNACATHNAELIDVLHKKGADVVLTWSGDFDGMYAGVKYFFDRLLGSNKILAVSVPQRAFDALSVWDGMLANNFQISIIHGTLNFDLAKDKPSPILVPSIAGLAGYPDSDGMMIWGLLGDKLPEVRAGNQVLVCKFVGSTLITCPHPHAMAPVTVIHDGRPSNAVLFNQWPVRLTFTSQSDAGKTEATIRSLVYGDLHQPHLTIDDKPAPMMHEGLYGDPASQSGTYKFTSNDPESDCHSGTGAIDTAKSYISAVIDMTQKPERRLTWYIAVSGHVGQCYGDWYTTPEDPTPVYATVRDDGTVEGGHATLGGENQSMSWDTFKPVGVVDAKEPR